MKGPTWAYGDIDHFMLRLKKSTRISRLDEKPNQQEVQKGNKIGNYCAHPPMDKADPGPAYVWKRVTWETTKKDSSHKGSFK